MNEGITGVYLRYGKSLSVGERVEVYYNLHKGGFSIKSIDKDNPNRGKVIGYADYVQIKNAKFVVSKQIHKVRKEQRKRVCAVVRGEFISALPIDHEDLTPIYFNPYQTDHFIDRTNLKPIADAFFVYFYDKCCAGQNLIYKWTGEEETDTKRTELLKYD